jgi:hypothetical protein
MCNPHHATEIWPEKELQVVEYHQEFKQSRAFTGRKTFFQKEMGLSYPDGVFADAWFDEPSLSREIRS